MKKLMTTLSAIAVAIGLQAVGVAETGTSFEGLSAGDYEITNQEGELSPQLGGTYWVTNGTQVLKVVNGLSLEDYFPSGIPQRPDIYMDNSSSQTNYLSIKTTLGSPAIRNLNADGTAADIGSGYYFDSLVKFTAFDVENEASAVVTNNGKLAIWLKEVLVEQDGEERPTATNLIVTAGFIDEDEPNGYRAVPMNYSCKVSGDTAGTYLCDGAWHRVTVRAINSIYKSGQTVTPGFAVFIDGNLVTCRNQAKGIDSTKLDPKLAAFDAVGAVFPSADQYTGKKAKIESVSFDGQGDVDDLVFTTTAPSFAEDKDVFTVALGEGVASASFVDGNGNEWSNVDSTTLVDWAEGLKIRVTSITAADGYTVFGYDADDYKDVIIDPDNLIDEDEGFWYKTTAAGQIITLTAKPATIKVGIGAESEWFETLSDAFEYVNDQASGDVKIELTAAMTGNVALANEDADVVLDLAGNNLTGVTAGEPVVAVSAGTLLITNSTVAVGHVIGVQNGDNPAISAYSEGGTLSIVGGCFDGQVVTDFGTPGLLSIALDAKLRIAENEDVLDDLNGYVTPAGYALVEEEGESPVYYVVGQDDRWTVTFMDGEEVYGDPQRVKDGELADVPDAPTKDGYEFNGWYEEGAAVPFNFATAITNNLTLYADWTLETYNITYNLDLEGATNAVANVSTYTYNDAVVILPAGCIGYTFNGWTNSEGQVVSAIALHSKDDVTLYASWTADTYNITYLNDDGTAFTNWVANYAAPATYTVARDVTLPTSTDIELKVVGAQFKGWTNETGTVTGWLAGEKTGDVTVYAKIEGSGAPVVINPGTGADSVEVAASDKADAISKVTIVPPTGSGIDTLEKEAAYLALLDINAEPVSGKDGYYEVTISIKDTVVTAVDTDAVAVFSGDTSVTIPQGLYYRITSATSLPIPASVEAGTLSDGTAITVTKPGTDKGFLRVELSVSPITPANN